MAKVFSAQVADAVKKRKDLIEETFRRSVQDVAAIAQTPGPSVFNPSGGRGGHMPIGETGFLRASLMATLGAVPPPQITNLTDSPASFDPGPINLTIAGAEVSDVITLAWTAVYARKVHRRYQWMSLAAQQWQAVVKRNAQEVAQEAGL